MLACGLGRMRKTFVFLTVRKIYILLQFFAAYFFRKLMVFSVLILHFAIIEDIFAAGVDIKQTHQVKFEWQPDDRCQAHQWYIPHANLVNGVIDMIRGWKDPPLKRCESWTSRLQGASVNLQSNARLSLSDLQQRDASFSPVRGDSWHL